MMKILAVFLWILVSNAGLGLISTGLLLYVGCRTDYYPLAVIYSLWYVGTWAWRRKATLGSEFVRRWRIWTCFCEYFPIRLVKTEELDPNQNYIFACHPHGIFAFGPFGAFATDGAGAKDIFPGLSFHFMVHSVPMVLPWRELLMSLGVLSVERESFDNLLRKGKGKVAAVMPGGLQEMLYTSPGGDMKVHLKSRKGFVRIALQHGAALVPVISFGENETFNQVLMKPGGLLHQVRSVLKKYFGLHFFLPYGKGFFGLEYGFLPSASPITTVVGSPITVTKMQRPTPGDIDKLHQEYMEALKTLYEENKVKYGDGGRRLQIC